jgi:hypothetical protein
MSIGVGLLILAGCATGARTGLRVHAGRPAQGTLQSVACDIPVDERSARGRPLLKVEAVADCTTEAKVVVLAFTVDGWIARGTFKRRVPEKPGGAPFTLEMTEVPDRGTEATVFVWSRCEDGESEQGVDTCQVP